MCLLRTVPVLALRLAEQSLLVIGQGHFRAMYHLENLTHHSNLMYGNLVPVSLDCGLSGYAFQLDTKPFHLLTLTPKCSQTNIPAIDSILTELVNHDPKLRPSAHQALNMLSSVVNKIPPKDLLVAPSVWEDGQQR